MKPDFYRYIRYMDFDISRGEMTTNPLGGIAFGFYKHNPEIDALAFVSARCHDEDRFDKTRAKHMVNRRIRINTMRGLHEIMSVLDYTQDVNILVDQILNFSLTWTAPEGSTSNMQYFELSLRELAKHIAKIRAHNAIENKKFHEWQALGRALDFGHFYRSLNS